VAISDNLETISEKHLVTPFNSKAMALVSGKNWREIHHDFNGKFGYAAIKNRYCSM
jgi:hypothetical protein